MWKQTSSKMHGQDDHSETDKQATRPTIPPPLNRRQFLRTLGAGSAAAMLSACIRTGPAPDYSAATARPAADKPATADYPFELPPLPYAYDALEPHIDEQTMRIHHDKHHAGYVRKLNTALEDYPDFQAWSPVDLVSDLEALPKEIRTAVRNNGGGHINHALFWEIMSPDGGGQPGGELEGFLSAIEGAFGDIESMKEKVIDAGLGRFGSGWAWLVLDNKEKLRVMSTPNQDSPYTKGYIPLLGIDVWEHAYYLNYQNERGEYLKAWWNVVNWEAVAARYRQAMS